MQPIDVINQCHGHNIELCRWYLLVKICAHGFVVYQQGARKGGGKSKPSPPPPLGKSNCFWLYCGPFCYVFPIMGVGPYHHVGAFCFFLLHAGGLFWVCPLSIRKFLRAPMGVCIKLNYSTPITIDIRIF